MDSVPAWLQALGLERYVQVFAENDVDLDAVRLLGESDLEKLGVSLGHRKRLKGAKALLVELAAYTRGPGWGPHFALPQDGPGLLPVSG